MRHVANLITGLGDWLVSLSDGTKKQLVLVALLVLGAGGVYKLVVSLNRLTEPQPVATPDQLMKPMGKLFDQTQEDLSQYRQARAASLNKLDSVGKIYSTQPPTKP